MRSFIAFILVCAAANAGEIKIVKDIPYLGHERAEKLDAYLPSLEFRRPLPAVIWIHGGGWHTGDKAARREVNVCRDLAENGYAAFSINYEIGKSGKSTESPRAGEVPWPQNLNDCQTAVRWLRKEAQRFGVDPARIGTAGGSAGGHLAMLAGVKGIAREENENGLYGEQDSRVSCIVDLYGIPDVSGPKWARHFAGATTEETEKNVQAASPLTYLGHGSPPLLIIHGDKDGIVPISASRQLAAELEKRGAAYQYVEVPGAPHSFDLQPKEMDLRPVILQFLAKYLGMPERIVSNGSQ